MGKIKRVYQGGVLYDLEDPEIRALVGSLTDLDTEDKSSIVAAVNETVKNLGVKSYSDLSNKPTINGVVLSGNKTNKDLGLADPSDAQVATAVSTWLDSHPEATTTVEDGSITYEKLHPDTISQLSEENMANGLTDTEKALMLSLFKAAAYTENVSAKVTQLEALWSGSGDSGGDSGDSGGDSGGSEGGGDTQTYTVTNNLTNVTSDNATALVAAGSGYTATLTVEDGCVLNSLVITMGGEDITDSVYGEGYILITNVTGDIVITAVAEEPQYVAMSTGHYTESANIYSDDGTTKVKSLNYQTGHAFSLLRTEEDVTVTVVLTNNTDADISGNAYVGSIDQYLVKTNYVNGKYAVAVSNTTFRAGGSTQVEYTLKAGKYLWVYAPNGVDVSAIGALVVHEPVAEIETATKSADTWTMYTDDGTTTLGSVHYTTGTYTTEAFDEDTIIRISIPGECSIAKCYWGCCDPSAPTTIHHAHQQFNDNSNVASGGIAVWEYTVKAGYAFVMNNFNKTVYIERM